ncbi:hypothetical protein J7M22_02840, partial [Candidatus Poribacteria bacterium]|nr:hypothetical protein [Candidatus Poribacteria bacterium]
FLEGVSFGALFLLISSELLKGGIKLGVDQFSSPCTKSGSFGCRCTIWGSLPNHKPALNLKPIPAWFLPNYGDAIER